jgi:GT2 family glycosyltransferase
MRKAVWRQLGGFDEIAFKVGYNDTDFCMRAAAAGLRVVYTPFATMYHYESQSRGVRPSGDAKLRAVAEADTFRRRWAGQLEDRYYNPRFERFAKPFTLLQSLDGGES